MANTKLKKSRSDSHTLPTKTLLDFFPTKSGATPSSAKKVKSTLLHQPPRRSSTLSQSPTKRSAGSVAKLGAGDENEVIVISDTDDDDPGPPSRVRKAPALKRTDSSLEDLGTRLRALPSHPHDLEKDNCDVYLPLLPRTETRPSSRSRPFGDTTVFDLTLSDGPEEEPTQLPTLNPDKSFDIEAYDVCSLRDPGDQAWDDDSYMDDSQDFLASDTQDLSRVPLGALAGRDESLDFESSKCPICLLSIAPDVRSLSLLYDVFFD